MERNVSPFLSITAKLFYFTTLLVLITASTLAIRTNLRLRDINASYTNDKLNNTVEKAMTITVRTLAVWENAIKVGLTTLTQVTADQRTEALKSLFSADVNYAGLGVYQSTNGSLTEVLSGFSQRTENAYTKALDLNNFHAQLKRKTEERLVAEIRKNPKATRLLFNLYDALKQPVIVMAYGATEKSSNSVYWGVLQVWQTQLLEALNAKDVTGAKPIMLGSAGQIFISPDSQDYKKGKGTPFANHPLFEEAQKKGGSASSDSPSFKKNYIFRNKTWNGSYQKINGYDITMIIEQNAEIAARASRSLLRESIFLSLFIILIAMFFAYFGASGLTANLKSVIEITRKISSGDFSASLAHKSRDEVGELSASVNQMATQILQLLQSQVQQARMEKELETATLVQETIFPGQTIVSGPITISGFNRAASECGGDWWGSFSAGEGIEYIFIADAMGHGVPAALVTAMAYATCTTLASMIKEKYRELGSPAAILERFNEVLYNAVRGRISMSFFALMIDTNKGVVTYANAGHNFPLLIPMNVGDDRAKKKKTKQGVDQVVPITLMVTGNILGITKKETYQEKSLELRPGDKIFLFTDGLVECKNPQGGAWGSRGLKDKLALFAGYGPEEFNQKIVEELYTFFDGTPQDDDITVIVAEVSKDCHFEAPVKNSLSA